MMFTLYDPDPGMEINSGVITSVIKYALLHEPTRLR